MRKIKFRIWDARSKRFYPDGFSVAMDGTEWYDDSVFSHSLTNGNWLLMQFTGLTDKNGVEIYEGDLLKCRFNMGNTGEYATESIWRVNNLSYEGVVIQFIKTTTTDDKNCYPISQSLGFDKGLATDYRNDKYTSLAIANTYGSNSMSRSSWQEHHYSNEVEIIGNIHENENLPQK